MQQLSEELTSTENKVAFSRQAYNDSVLKYNNQRETFPTSVLAGMFHFSAGRALGDRSRSSRDPRGAEGAVLIGGDPGYRSD